MAFVQALCQRHPVPDMGNVEIEPPRATLERWRAVRRRDYKEHVLEYLLLIHTNPASIAAMPDAERDKNFAAYMAYTEALGKAQVLRGSNRLRPASSGTTVRLRAGKTEVHNGPFAETREELGGYYLIDVPDLDVALTWAARCPAASHGAVEVRPVWPRGAA